MNKTITKQIAIMINDKCNLQCSYCYQNHNRSNKEISQELINKLINYFKTDNKYNSIMFYGGETMMSPKIIKQFIIELKDKYHYMIMTNGTISLESFCKELEDHKENFTFGFSYDGLNQTNRGISDINKIYKNIKFLHQNNFAFKIMHVLNSNAVFNLNDNILFLSSIHPIIKVRRICNLHDCWTDEAKQYFIENISKTTLLVCYLNNIKNCRISLPNQIQFEPGSEGITRHAFYCQNSLATGSNVIGIDGSLYPCENRAANNIEKYGNAPDDLDKSVYIPHLNDTIYNICTMYATVEPKIDEALEEQRFQYQEYKKKFLNLKYNGRKNK